jgi:hypothetical protein
MLLGLEEAAGKGGAPFVTLDALVGRLLVRSLRGERVVELSQDDLYVYRVSALGLSSEERSLVDEWFALKKQQSRGTWTIPDKTSLRAGFPNLLWSYTQTGRFGTAAAVEDRGPVKLESTPDAVFHWAVLEGLFESLCLPFQLRGPLAGEKTREQQLEAWNEVDTFYSALGFDVQEELSVMRYGGGWHRLNASGQLAVKVRLLEALGNQANVEVGARYRAHRTLPLIHSFYNKAKKDGLAKRKQVVTKELEKVLCAYWGGDWLSFLDYLGEQPHPEEQVVTALPKVKPLVSQSARIEEIATAQGLPAEVIKSIAASFWQETGGVSPVERRVQCLRNYWEAYDDIHARQGPKMKPLWGLLNDSRLVALASWEGRDLYQQELFRELLPENLLSEISELWSGTMLSRWPDRIITEPFPYPTMVETFGPALAFWDGCSLTAWFLCEGPYSRTDMSGLAHYHRRDVAALDAASTPVDKQLFANLIEAEKQLGSPEQIENESSTTDYGMFSVKISVGGGTRRKGFEKLRDVITRHRRAWAQQHLEEYLKNRWESEIAGAAKAYNLLVHGKEGKVPTLKQFAKAAAPATNRWFGGDVCGLYGAIREKCPARPERIRIMPHDVSGFARALFVSLTSEAARYRGDDEAKRYSNYIEVLANLGIKYVQLEEALGRPPAMKDLGERFVSHTKAVKDDDPESVWIAFVDAVENAKAAAYEGVSNTPVSEPQMSPSVREVRLSAGVEFEEGVAPVTREDNDHQSVEAKGTGRQAAPQPNEEHRLKRSWWQRLTGK